MMMKIGLLVCGLLVLAAAGDSACPSGWTKKFQSCWKFYLGQVPWRAAKNRCRSEDAELAYIMNHKQNNFIKSLAGHKKPWIGLASCNNWHNLKWLYKHLPVTYTHWDTNQPRDGPPFTERCALVNNRKGTAVWHSYPCTRRFPFVCRKPVPCDLLS